MMCRFESDHRHSLEINELFNRGTTPVDTPPGVVYDKIMTKSGVTPRKKGKPFLRIKHGSAVVPIAVLIQWGIELEIRLPHTSQLPVGIYHAGHPVALIPTQSCFEVGFLKKRTKTAKTTTAPQAGSFQIASQS